MNDPNAIAEDYLAAWNEDDARRRLSRLQAGWTDDADYTDPVMRGCGPEGIAQMIEGARSRFPGHTFQLTGSPDGHSDVVRFSWLLNAPDGSCVARGTDFVRLDPDGRIASVTGFLDAA